MVQQCPGSVSRQWQVDVAVFSFADMRYQILFLFADDDFVTLRDDMEIQMLDLQSVLGETILKFVPLGR